MQSVERCCWACLRVTDYLKRLTRANLRYSFVIQIHTINLVNIGSFYTLKIPPMVNTLIHLANLHRPISERFFIAIVKDGFTLIEICKVLLVDFVDIIVYSIAYIE